MSGVGAYRDGYDCLNIDPYEEARKVGCVVVTPAPNEIFVDIDTAEDLVILRDVCRRLEENDCRLELVRMTPSRSGGVRRHAVLRAPFELDDLTRVAFQACLGSDRVREALAILRLRKGVGRPVTCFFERLAEPGTGLAAAAGPGTGSAGGAR